MAAHRCDKDREAGVQWVGFKSLSGSPALLRRWMGTHSYGAASLADEHYRLQECRAPKIYG